MQIGRVDRTWEPVGRGSTERGHWPAARGSDREPHLARDSYIGSAADPAAS
jgi:hypothetical protein